MSDLELFRIDYGKAIELSGSSVALERQPQKIIESTMEALFSVCFLASEYSTGPKHRGYLDSLGIDQTGSPVIFEYKRSRDENVINQGLLYTTRNPPSSPTSPACWSPKSSDSIRPTPNSSSPDGTVKHPPLRRFAPENTTGI